MKMKSDDKCVLCNVIIKTNYVPMKQWKIEGKIFGKCYPKKNFRILSRWTCQSGSIRSL